MFIDHILILKLLVVLLEIITAPYPFILLLLSPYPFILLLCDSWSPDKQLLVGDRKLITYIFWTSHHVWWRLLLLIGIDVYDMLHYLPTKDNSRFFFPLFEFLCEACIFEKQHCTIFPTHFSRSNAPFLQCIPMFGVLIKLLVYLVSTISLLLLVTILSWLGRICFVIRPRYCIFFETFVVKTRTQFSTTIKITCTTDSCKYKSNEFHNNSASHSIIDHSPDNIT